MEYRELGELNPPFILSPRTLFDYRQAILLFKPAFYPTRSPPPVHQTPPPLSRIFKVGAVHTVITIKPRSRPPSLPYIYPPSRYLGLSGTIKRVCAIAIAIVVAREKGEKKIVDAGKEQKGSAEAFSERAHIQREVRRGCVRAPPSSLSLSLCGSVGARGSIRGRKEEVRTKSEANTRRTREQKEGQTGRSERGTRGCHGYRRIPASPRCHGDASRPSLHLSLFHLFRLPSVRLPRPPGVAPRPFPSAVPSHAPLLPPASLTPRFSPSSRQASLYLSGSFAHILSVLLGTKRKRGPAR